MSSDFSWFQFAAVIGISYYALSAIGYLIDVYWESYRAERNIVNVGLFIFYFPQLISGPFTRYGEMAPQFNERTKLDYSNVTNGIRRMIWGYFKKLVISERFGIVVATVYGDYHSYSMIGIAGATLCYAIQLYTDFSGCMDIIMGASELFGIKLPENFRAPFFSQSIQEFWQRWHMTLGRWFREYVYFPLGGSRCSKGKMIRNLLVVWMLTGIWHGSGWNFILWGFGLFLMIALEKLFLKKYLDKWVIFSRIYMWCWIPVSWVVFAITDTERLLVYLSRMFPWLLRVEMNSNVNSGDIIRYGKSYLPILLAAVLFSVPAVRRRLMLLRKKKVGAVLAFLIFVLSVYCLSAGLDNPFLYYQF